MKKRPQILLLIMGIALLGCEKKENEQFFTFGEVGNSWTFKHTQTSTVHGIPEIDIDTITISITGYEGNNIYTLSDGNRWYISGSEFGTVSKYNGSLYIYINKYSVYNNDKYTRVSSTDDHIVMYGNYSLNCFHWSHSHTSWTGIDISRQYGIVGHGYSDFGYLSEDWELIDKNF